MQPGQSHLIDKDYRKKFDKRQLVAPRFDDLPKLFNYQGKRIFHVVAQSLLTVAEIDREHMNMLIEAFPAWLGLI